MSNGPFRVVGSFLLRGSAHRPRGPGGRPGGQCVDVEGHAAARPPQHPGASLGNEVISSGEGVSQSRGGSGQCTEASALDQFLAGLVLAFDLAALTRFSRRYGVRL